jgi:hypothetical protein
MRKWQYIEDALRVKNAPEKVINAAKSIDNALVALGFDLLEWRSYEDGNYAKYDSWVDINNMIYDIDNCPACCNCDHYCEDCVLGDDEHCTPRSKHADDYFRIVSTYAYYMMKNERSNLSSLDMVRY